MNQEYIELTELNRTASEIGEIPEIGADQIALFSKRLFTEENGQYYLATSVENGHSMHLNAQFRSPTNSEIENGNQTARLDLTLFKWEEHSRIEVDSATIFVEISFRAVYA